MIWVNDVSVLLLVAYALWNVYIMLLNYKWVFICVAIIISRVLEIKDRLNMGL